jgi:hypothetical protein
LSDSLDEQALDRLYTLPPEEFTAARNELAKSLRDEGGRAEADVVRGLRRPSPAAWVLNQLARTRAKEIRGLVEAGERLRKIQASGKGDLRAATQAERAAVAGLLDQARSILEESGRAPTEATLGPVRTTLAAAAADREAAEQLRAGRLERELEPPAFGGLLEQMPQRSPPAGKRAAAKTAKADARRALEREQAKARTRAAEARRITDEAERQTERSKREWERAQEAAKAAASELKAAEAEVKALDRRLR